MRYRRVAGIVEGSVSITNARLSASKSQIEETLFLNCLLRGISGDKVFRTLNPVGSFLTTL